MYIATGMTQPGIRTIRPAGTLKNPKRVEAGAKFYDKLAKKFSDNREIFDLFTLLAKDERIHKAQFSKILENLPDEMGISSTPERAQYLKAMSISEFFSPKRGPFKDVDAIEDRDDALEKAFGLEKATLGFYQAVRDILSGDMEELIKIIDAEKGHVVKIMEVMITSARFRGMQDNWS
jgi:rubrerythrin